MGNKKDDAPPFGGFFGVIGAIVGFSYAVSVTEHLGAALALGIIGFGLGIIVEHIVFRLIVIGLFLVMILARQVLFDAVSEAFSYQRDLTPPAIEQQIVQSINKSGGAGKMGAET